MEHTKGTMRSVSTFDKMYLHINGVRIADIPRTGAINDVERALNLAHFVKCWNSHDNLLAACDELINVTVQARELSLEGEPPRGPVWNAVRSLLDSTRLKAEQAIAEAKGIWGLQITNERQD